MWLLSCCSRSSMNCFLMVKGRPASFTSACPCCSIWSRSHWNRCLTWAAAEGAARVTTASASGMSTAAFNTAAPPSECPIKMLGASYSAFKKLAAATRSSTLELKLVLAKSPSELPRPVKSKRNTAKPILTSALLMWDAAMMSLPQVKQWANKT